MNETIHTTTTTILGSVTEILLKISYRKWHYVVKITFIILLVIYNSSRVGIPLV